MPPVPRSKSGYRLFFDLHLEQVRLVRMTLRHTPLGGGIRRQALGVVERAAARDDDELYCHCVFDQWRLALVEAEENARRMIDYLEGMSIRFK